MKKNNILLLALALSFTVFITPVSATETKAKVFVDTVTKQEIETFKLAQDHNILKHSHSEWILEDDQRIEKKLTENGYNLTLYDKDQLLISLETEKETEGVKFSAGEKQPSIVPFETCYYLTNSLEDNWYVNQLSTSPYGDINCVPASIEMVQKWLGDDTDFNYEKFRRTYLNYYNGATYELEMVRYLKENKIKFKNSWSYKLENMIQSLDEGNIMIVLYTPQKTKKGEYTDRYYSGNDSYSHCVVISGYAYEKKSHDIYFEIKDPLGLSEVKNKNIGDGRFFKAEDFINGIRAAMWDIYSFSQDDQTYKNKRKEDNIANAILSSF